MKQLLKIKDRSIKYLYLLLATTLLASGCTAENNNNVASEGTKEESGEEVATHPDAQKIIAALIAPEFGWKMSYAGKTFILQFDENETVSTNSDLPFDPIESIFYIKSVEGKAVLSILGSGHFRYIEAEGKNAPLFTVDISSGLKFSVDGAVLDVVNATEGDVVDHEKEFFAKINNKNGINGVFVNGSADKLIAHYAFDSDNSQIMISYINSTDNLVDHVTYKYTVGDMNVTWEQAADISGMQISGIRYDETLDAITPITESKNMQIRGNSHVAPLFLTKNKQYVFADSDQTVDGWISEPLATEINAFRKNGLNAIEFNWEREEFSVVALLGAPLGGYVFYQAMPAGSTADDVDYKLDRIYWESLTPVGLYGGEPHADATKKALAQFAAAYVDKGGYYIIPLHTIDGSTVGKQWLMLGAETDQWIKIKAKK